MVEDVVVVAASMTSGTSGSMNVVVVVAWVVDVDVLDDVLVDVLDDVTAADADGGGTHDSGGADVPAGDELGGAVAAADWPAWTIPSSETATTARRTIAAEPRPPTRRCRASTVQPLTRARVPTSRARPNDPPDAGRLQTVATATGAQR